MLAAYNPSTLALLIATLIMLDLGQEVPDTNQKTSLAPQFAFHILV